MILNAKPTIVFQCRDGSFSTHNRTGACTWHGGLRSGKKIKLAKSCKGANAGAQMVPLEWVHVAHGWFQNRAKAFSLRSVNNIIKAAQDGSFKWANMDAITLWRNPDDNKLYVLSGHSRHEAFKQLCAAGVMAEGKGFCLIPAKVVKASLATAKRIALESNTLSTKESDIERATFYRRQREGGTDITKLINMVKRLEGRNANTIFALSYLNPAGKTMLAMQALENGQADSKTVLTNVARWIGNARKRNQQLTDRHENELFEWLISRRGYGSKSGQVNNERKFADRLASIVNRRSTFGQLEDSLNIADNIQQSPVERQYNAQLEEAKAEIREHDKNLKTKVISLANRGATEEEVRIITLPIEVSLRRARLRYQSLMAKSGAVKEAARNEQSLFSMSGTGQKKSVNLLSIALLVGAYLVYRR